MISSKPLRTPGTVNIRASGDDDTGAYGAPYGGFVMHFSFVNTAFYNYGVGGDALYTLNKDSYDQAVKPQTTYDSKKGNHRFLASINIVEKIFETKQVSDLFPPGFDLSTVDTNWDINVVQDDASVSDYEDLYQNLLDKVHRAGNITKLSYTLSTGFTLTYFNDFLERFEKSGITVIKRGIAGDLWIPPMTQVFGAEYPIEAWDSITITG